MRRVLIVQEGQWGTLRPEDYRDLTAHYVCIISEAKREFSNNFGPEKKGDKEAVVEVAATAGEAEEKIRKEAANERTDVVIFISRDMGVAAEKFAVMFPKIKIIVLTGLIPEGKVIWLNKLWVADPEVLQKVVLSG